MLIQVTKVERLSIQKQSDIVAVRQLVRRWAVELQFGIIDQTKVITAASELARNTLDYGLGGEFEIASGTNSAGKVGLRLIFEDHGPGIPDTNLALQDGYSTGGGLGMGLSGSKRLMNQFEIETGPGTGTRLTAYKWK